MHPYRQHFLIMRAVEDADAPALRQVFIDSPEEIVGELLDTRRLEGVDGAALRIDARHHVLDDASPARKTKGFCRIEVGKLEFFRLVDPAVLDDLGELHRQYVRSLMAKVTRAEVTRAKITRAKITRAKVTRAEVTRAEVTRAEVTRDEVTRAEVTRATD
jgi:hypothetical protein